MCKILYEAGYKAHPGGVDAQAIRESKHVGSRPYCLVIVPPFAHIHNNPPHYLAPHSSRK